jgi:hypothetical protein
MSATSNTGRSKKPARLVTREIALGDVTDALERMTRFDQVGFEVITRSPRSARGGPRPPRPSNAGPDDLTAPLEGDETMQKRELEIDTATSKIRVQGARGNGQERYV